MDQNTGASPTGWLFSAPCLYVKGGDLLRDEALWWFNLACYDCQLGDLDAAKARLARAFEMIKSTGFRTLEDEECSHCAAAGLCGGFFSSNMRVGASAGVSRLSVEDCHRLAG